MRINDKIKALERRRDTLKASIADIDQQYWHERMQARKSLEEEISQVREQISHLKRRALEEAREASGFTPPSADKVGHLFHVEATLYGHPAKGLAVFSIDEDEGGTFVGIDGELLFEVDNLNNIVTVCEEVSVVPTSFLEDVKQAIAPDDTPCALINVFQWADQHSAKSLCWQEEEE